MKFWKRTGTEGHEANCTVLCYLQLQLQLQLCSYSLIIRFDGPVGLKHVSQQNRIHEVVLEGRPKRQQQNQQ